MNDGLRTDIFLRYKPETIACACIYLAARTIENPIPLPKDPYPWYELYDASDRDVKTISEILMRLYQRNRPPSWSKLIATIEKLYQELFKPEPVVEPPKQSQEEPKKERKELTTINGDSKYPSRGARYDRKASPDERGRDRNRRYRDEEPSRQRSPYARARDRSDSLDRDRYRREVDDRNGKYRDDKDRERSYSKLGRDERDRKKDKKERKRGRTRSRSRDRKKDKVSRF